MPSIKKLLTSLGYAISGLATTWQTQNNFRWHCLGLVLVIILGLVVDLKAIEWVVIFIISVLVLVVELVNTVMERLVDLAKPRVHVYAKIIKDVMAGATLLVAMVAIVVGLLIFLPHLKEIL